MSANKNNTKINSVLFTRVFVRRILRLSCVGIQNSENGSNLLNKQIFTIVLICGKELNSGFNGIVKKKNSIASKRQYAACGILIPRTFKQKVILRGEHLLSSHSA